MRSLGRFLAGITVLAITTFAFRAEPAAMGFGATVLVGEGEVFVGEAANQFRPGTVYVYRKGTAGWQQAATITRPEAAVGDRFGSSLTLSGTRLIVGAGPAALHVFDRQGATWIHTGAIGAAAVTGVDPATVQFGAVGASGEWLMVGQALAGAGRRGGGPGGRGGANAPPQPAGKVYVFRSAGAGYSYVATLVSPEQETAGDGFGSAIALAEGSALIGASGHAGRAGLVHEFVRDAAGAWTRARSFAPQGVGVGEAFGSSIELRGTQAVVTAPGDAGGYGAAYVWRKVEQAAGRRGGAAGAAGTTPSPAPAGGNFTWQEVTRLAQSAGGRGNGFATSVSADANEVWVSSPRAGGAGGVFVFRHDAFAFPIEGPSFLTPTGIAPAAAAGQSVSVRGNVAAVGATALNLGGGGVVIYEREGNAWREQPLITPPLDELPAFVGQERRCDSKGKVEMFDCASTELLSFLPPSKLTHDAHYIQLSGIWGWTDARTKREWALIGRRDGSTFVDITNATAPIVVADMPLTPGARPNSWREIKVYKDHAYVVADGAGPHGLQIFDLTRLRTLTPQPNGLPVKVEPDLIYREIASAHNIVINEESGFAYSVGGSAGGTTCGGGLHMIDIREPKAPKFVGCFADVGTGRAGTGYSHDAQCVTYKGPDKRYKGREICIGSNETAISIADVTDKSAPKALSRSGYPAVSYTHQGWLTDDHRYFYVNDELDETGGLVQKTRTLIWDLSDLESPRLAKEHFGVEAASDHNLYVVGDYMHQANYKSGLRVLNIRDRENPREVAFFDTAPYGDNGPGFQGAWSLYPYYRSGLIVISSIEQGLFVVRPSDRPIKR